MRDTPIFKSTDPMREVALFMNKDGSAEIVVQGPEVNFVKPLPNRLNVPKPPHGQRIVIIHHDRAVEIVYRDEEK
jgi:hypothetical protein